MICPNCNTPNDANYEFCVNCGKRFESAPSVATQFAGFGQSVSPGVEKRRSPLVWIGVIALVLLVVVGGAIFAAFELKTPGEVLPDHLGMFVQAETKDHYDEIRKQDFANALDGKAALTKDETLPNVPPSPSLIFYADAKDINVNDLRLIQLDTIKDDGSMKQIDFQAAQVEGKPDMKRLRVPDALANGKYAFAAFDSFMNEGKQRFWAFQVRNSSKTDNGDALKATSVPVKAKPSASPAPTASVTRVVVPSSTPQPGTPPPGATVAYTKTTDVIVRSAPNMSAAKRAKLGPNQPVYILGYTGYDCFKGFCGAWAQVQTPSGASGYILSVLLR